MADDGVYSGTWRIVKCLSLAGGTESSGIEGTEFTLDESGDVTWKVTENAEFIPIFNCENFEVFLGNPHLLKFFGNIAGHVIEFRVDQPKEDCLQLTYEGWCVLQCEKVQNQEGKHDQPFSFLCALEEGYFSDLTITAGNGKQFKVHSTILCLANPEVDWSCIPSPLDGLSEDVLQAILHYLYSECLPRSLHEDTAKQCLLIAATIPGLQRFSHLCQLFLKNSALKQQIISLVTDIHSCGNRVIDYFSGKTNLQQFETPPPNGPGPNAHCDTENLVTNPAKLCYVIKQALRESAIAGAKLVILCDLFSRKKNELSREERHEIIKYCKSRLPHFMSQLHKLLEVIKHSFSNLSDGERMEIFSYFVPEVEATYDSMFQLIMETKTALEQIISSSSGLHEKDRSCPCTLHEKSSHRKGNVGEVLSRSLKNALHFRELLKLRSFHEKVTVSFMNIMHRKEYFNGMSVGSKIRCIDRNLDQIMEEIPVFLLRIEEFKAAVDEKLSWKEWKYLFKLATSKVAWILSKLVSHRGILRNIINYICSLVNRDQFNRSLLLLDLLEGPAVASQTKEHNLEGNTKPSSSQHTNGIEEILTGVVGNGVGAGTGSESKGEGSGRRRSGLSPDSNASQSTSSSTSSPTGNIPSNQFLQQAALESLCQPPLSQHSCLAWSALQLLRSSNATDVSFHIITSQDLSDDAENPASNSSSGECEGESHIVKAHCVIIAARCDWFRRALLSGMRESIDKRIVVHDTNPALFRMFLEYLYSGQLDPSQLTTEQLADLMQLSDRYEVDALKHLSEDALQSHIDEDSALFLLSIADQFNARALRNAALEFIAMNKEIIRSEVFSDLPEDLQSEVGEMVTWAELRNSQHSEEFPCPQYLSPDSPSSMSSSLLDIDELTSAMNISGKESDVASDSSSLEDLPLVQDCLQLDTCVAQLRDVVGQAVPREELVRIALAADYDVNRALNFFFS